MKQSVIGIVGIGLIGGSIGMRARRNGAFVVGYDIDAGTQAAALEVGAIDMAASREELYAKAGTVVLSAYTDGIVREIEKLRTEGPIRATLVVDIASVKEPVVTAAEGLRNFVGTHPIAGTERSGVRAAKPDLFERRTWAYVSSGDATLDGRACALIASLGAAPLAIGAAEHDRIVAFTSHLPQILAWAYARRAERHSSEALDPLVGHTARELLRLGRSGFGFWRSVLAANADNIEPDLRAIAAALHEAADGLRDGAVERLATELGAGSL
jgi:prephenate dehydrogenase